MFIFIFLRDKTLYMRKKYHSALLLILLLFAVQSSNGQNSRPKIGLTLSGGGAKGIAHIGVLKAIDSVGLKIDYVTGTSMGAVVGGLYAAGYNADEILEIAKTLDRTSLLSNDLPVSSLNLKEKKEFGHYFELPLIRGKLALKRGFIESNELWLKLAELYYPYYEIDDFSKFEKGFQCIAADVATGKMVVLKKGNIVNAVRASMAIPSVFTPVEIDGKVLVDGGIVRNFPVSNVREMGADFVIGSDVSGDQDPVDKIQSPLDIISRLPFFNAVKDLEEQKKLVDVYVDYPLGNYGTSSFSAEEQIIKIGLEKGKEIYPRIKRLKDSLDLIYGKEIITQRVQKSDSVFISKYEIDGLSNYEKPAFVDLIDFVPNSYYTASQLGTSIRSAFSTRAFTKINYSLVPVESGKAKIIFDVDKGPTTFARLGLQYNTTTGIGLKTGFVKKGFLVPFSTTSFDISIGENPRAKLEYGFYLTKNRKWTMELEATIETIDINTYNPEFSSTGLYNQVSQNTDFQIVWQPDNNWALGIGTSLGYVAFEPKIISQIEANGNLQYMNTYLFLHHNTFNTPLYPNRGSDIYIKAGVIYNQNVNFTIYQNGDELANNDNGDILKSSAYTQLRVNFEKYFPINKSALFVQLQSGMNFNYKQAIMNDFVIGGLTNVIRNQITFSGLPEASIFTASAISLKVGYQQAITNNLFVIAKVNGLYYDFVTSNFRLNTIPHQGIGYSLTGGYRTFLGPIEASLMYSDFNKRIMPYFNLGYILSLD
jgi:NTE family protein